MTYPQSIFASALVLALAIIANRFTPSVQAGGRQLGQFALEKSDAGAWRINTATGQVSHCTFELDQKNELVVRCLPWAN